MTEFLALLLDYPALATGLGLLLGLMVGSFLNVVIYRLPRMLEIAWAAEIAEMRDAVAEPVAGSAVVNAAAHTTSAHVAPGNAAVAGIPREMTASGLPAGGLPDPSLTGAVPGRASSEPVKRFNLMVPRSSCPHCGHQIRSWENIPVLGWLALGGKCSACRAPISIRYPAVELLTGVLSALAIAHFGATLAGAGAVLLLWFLVALTFIDVDTQLLPDSMTLPLLWIGLLINLVGPYGTYVPLADAVVGAVIGYLLLWSIYWLFKLVTGKEGMGYGDFKLLAALGAWFGWQAIPSIILLSSVVGAVIGIVLIVLAKRGREVPMPFGPYLAGAGALMLFFREPLGAMFGLR